MAVGKRSQILIPAVAAVLVTLATSAPAPAQTAANVAVVINMASTASQRVGEHYVRRRGIPESNVIRIRTVEDETIARDAYAATIENPVAAALTRERLHDRVLYIVLTKGVPL